MKILICSENTLFSTITVAESVCREISADTMTLVSITVKIFILFTSSGRSYFFVDFFQSHPCQSVLFRFFAECPERPASPFRHFIYRVCFNLKRYPPLAHDGLYIYVECRICTHTELLAKFIKLCFQVRVQSDGCCCLFFRICRIPPESLHCITMQIHRRYFGMKILIGNDIQVYT